MLPLLAPSFSVVAMLLFVIFGNVYTGQSRGHCVLVASGNAQQSPRGMATAVLTTIRNCQAGSSSRFYVSTGWGWGVLAPQPHACPLWPSHSH